MLFLSRPCRCLSSVVLLAYPLPMIPTYLDAVGCHFFLECELVSFADFEPFESHLFIEHRMAPSGGIGALIASIVVKKFAPTSRTSHWRQQPVRLWVYRRYWFIGHRFPFEACRP